MKNKAKVSKKSPDGVDEIRIPVHRDEAPVRIVELDENSYLHRSPNTPPLSKRQHYAVAAYKRGVPLPEIAKASGLPIGTLLKTVGETDPKEISDLERWWYEQRRDPCNR